MKMTVPDVARTWAARRLIRSMTPGKSCLGSPSRRPTCMSTISSASMRWGNLAVEQLHRRFVHAGVAGGDDTAAALSGLAVPGGDDAAGAGDDRNQGRDVIGLQLGLDHEVEMTGRQHAIGIAIAAVARQ